jgi:adenylylsulfate kinase-like enzyme
MINKAFTLWFTGLSGSGKRTLALRSHLIALVFASKVADL